jgi:hypothetical protein
MFADFITPDDPRWLETLERVTHDVYHLPEYSQVAARHECGTPVAFYAEHGSQQLLIPLLVRDIPRSNGAAAWKDVTSPYGYPGPLATEPDNYGALWSCLEAFAPVATRHRIVSGFLRLHPILGISADLFAPHARVVRHGEIVYFDLRRSLPELAADMRTNHKRNIRALEKAGFNCRIDDWTRYQEFGPIYRDTMTRVAAEQFYFFSDEYFVDLQQMLGGRLHFCTVVAPDGALAAAGLFTAVNAIVEYHLGATAADFLGMAPSKLMFETAIRWSHGKGEGVLNLGGGVGAGGGSLFEFKAGFGGLRAAYHTVRMVFDQQVYDELTYAGPRASAETSADGYFPAYRRPVDHTTPAAQ